MPLKAKNIYFHYGKGSFVLKNMNITVEPGEVVGVSGPSGCGKTTFARILAGVEQPHAGEVTLNGRLLIYNGYSPVQIVFQHPEKAVNPRWRMKDTLTEGWMPDDAILESLGIDQSWLNRWPNELSGGELQRFCLARSLGPKTRYLIADEITTMLDAVTQAQIWSVVLDMVKKRNMGVLVVSHEHSLIERLCNRTVELQPF